MTTAEVQSLVRSVIVVSGLPFAVVSVNDARHGWTVVVRGGTGGIVRFNVAGGERDAMRWTIRRLLEAEL